MNIPICTGVAAIGCVFLASCYPVDENPRHNKTPKTPEKTEVLPDPMKLKEQEALKQKEQEALAQEKNLPNAGNSTPSNEKPKPEPKRDNYPVAIKALGKEGFVISPYNSKMLDVRGIPSGTLAQDPTYPAAEKKYFRVP